MSRVYWVENNNKIYQGNVLEVLKLLPDESIQMCVTSPPYWGQRDYGTNPLIWDGSDDCDHQWEDVRVYKKIGRDDEYYGGKQYSMSASEHRTPKFNKVCSKCNACECSLGLENTPELYVNHLSQILMEVKRVLKNDGTFWLNLGDCYHDKQLVGIPWRVALALKDDGWHLRSEIIWSKPNAMTEPVQDRPTKSHEHIFLLSKSDSYHYDLAAIKVPIKGRVKLDNIGQPLVDDKKNKRSVWSIPTETFPAAHFAVFPPEIPITCIKAGSKEGDVVLDPFFGSGTTGLVCDELKRHWIGIELSDEYCELAKNRILEVIEEKNRIETNEKALNEFF